MFNITSKNRQNCRYAAIYVIITWYLIKLMPKEVYAKYVSLFSWKCGILKKKTSDLKKSKVKGPKPVTNDMHSQRYFI